MNKFEPTIVYKKGTKHRGPMGRPYDYMAVNSKMALDAALEKGWDKELEVAVGLRSQKEIDEERAAERKSNGEPSLPDNSKLVKQIEELKAANAKLKEDSDKKAKK